MPNSSGFSDILKQHLSWHKARIDCLASIITALFVRQTVNLSALKNAFSSKARPESIYRRMQRFFAGDLIGRTDVACFVFPVFGWQNLRLTLERTTWEYGKSCINILVLAVVWHGVAIPVPTQANECFCWNFSVRPFPKSISKPSMLTGSSLAMNGWRICVKQGFLTAPAARKTRR
nr:hypothetical protein [Cardiobacterium valvarum]